MFVLWTGVRLRCLRSLFCEASIVAVRVTNSLKLFSQICRDLGQSCVDYFNPCLILSTSSQLVTLCLAGGLYINIFWEQLKSFGAVLWQETSSDGPLGVPGPPLREPMI